jgi:hypothetical protein
MAQGSAAGGAVRGHGHRLGTGGQPRCQGCGRVDGHIAYSHRLGQRVCWACYHGSFKPEEIAEAERVELQREIARAIRHVLDTAAPPDWQETADRALVIETAGDADEVLELLDEVERFGVTVERR